MSTPPIHPQHVHPQHVHPQPAQILTLSTGAFAELLVSDRPLVDLRAPVEYGAGTFPAAVNLPLLNDEERHQVGLCYKQSGQQDAIALGQQLVNGATRAARLAAWSSFACEHPDALLYCWRGGLRSQTVQSWLLANGVTLARIAGGYKALRQLAIDALETAATQCPGMVVLGGRTGSGKTALLNEFAASIDLEQLARHRGSSFGQRPNSQQNQVDFEHALLRALLRALLVQQRAQQRGGQPCVLFEDESRTIGRVAIPQALHSRLKLSPLVVLDVALAARAAHIEQEYVHQALNELQQARPADALDALQAQLSAALARIERRLGGERHGQIAVLMHLAFARHRNGDTAGHAHWVQALLTHYYDPMYDYQLGQNEKRIVFRGDRAAVRAWLTAHLRV